MRASVLGGEYAGEPIVLCRDVRHIVGLIDHHGIPLVIAQIPLEARCFNVSIEMITRLK